MRNPKSATASMHWARPRLPIAGYGSKQFQWVNGRTGAAAGYRGKHLCENRKLRAPLAERREFAMRTPWNRFEARQTPAEHVGRDPRPESPRGNSRVARRYPPCRKTANCPLG